MAGTFKNVILSRKVMGLVVALIGYVLKEFFDVTLDEDSVVNTIVVGASYLILAHGMIMQFVSYVRSVVDQIKRFREKNDSR